MQRIRHIGVISAGSMLAGVYFFIGLIAALVSLVFGLGGYAYMPSISGYIGIGLLGTIGAIVIVVIIGMIVGFILGALTAIFYNVVASVFGGIAVELEDE